MKSSSSRPARRSSGRPSVGPSSRTRSSAASAAVRKPHKPVPLPEVPGGLDITELLDCLRKVNRPLALDDLLRFLDLSRRDKKALLALLDHLQAEGRVVRLNGGRWADAGQLRHITGILGVQRAGFGFVTPDRQEKAPLRPGEPRTADIFISPYDMGDAWHGDRVEVALQPPARPAGGRLRSRGRDSGPQTGRSPEGRILRVIERAHAELTVLVSRHTTAGVAICRPADPRINVALEVDTSSLAQRPDPGTLLRVRPGDKLRDDLWQATALAALGREDSVAVQEELVRLNHGIPFDVPASALAEAEAVATRFEALTEAERLAEGREDLRRLPLVTIDGPDARDFDDAVCVLPQAGNGWTLWVAIADVTHFVQPGSALDREARERGNSYYFPASVTPMLPEALSNGVCSLRPHEDRFAVAVAMNVDARGAVTGVKPCRALIRSRARLTYEAVQALYDHEPVLDPAITPDLAVMLTDARVLATTLQNVRNAHGNLDLDLPEARFLVDDKGCVTDAVRRERLFSHRLIEAFMLTANEAVAEWLTAKGAPLPYRVHPAPDPDRVAALFRMIRTVGLAATALPPRKAGSAQKDDALTPQELGHALAALLAAAKGSDDAFLVGRLVLRSLMQARYSPFQDIHFGIASSCYCHFTSPIRRYADVLVHRSLKHALGHGPTPLAEHRLLAVCEQCNGREKAAQEAEREIARRLGCLLLAPRVGEVFAGVVSGVSEFGFFVELEALPVEGMVRLATLDHDWFVLDPDRQELVGQGTGQRFRLGNRVNVRLTDVHVGRLEISFVVETTTTSTPPRRTPRRPRRN